MTTLLSALAWAVGRSSLDVGISDRFFDSTWAVFAGRRSAWLDLMGHRFARVLPISVGAAAIGGALIGCYVERARRWRPMLLCLGISMILGPLIIDRVKYFAAAHCPVDMTMYGGLIDYRADRSGPLFASSRASAGHCVPSGHAGGGYALLALYFAGWASGRPLWRWTGLAIGIAAGVSFSVVRIAQGAHFTSQTLWSAPIDWFVAALAFMLPLCQVSWKIKPD